MSQLPKDLLIVGRFGSPHGVKGYLKIQAYTQPRDNILQYQPWLVENSEGEWKPVEIENIAKQAKQLVVKLHNYPTREDAKRLTHKEIATHASNLPKLKRGDYYWSELIGLDVSNREGVNFGLVIDLMATGSNDVLVIEDETKSTRLIPYLPEQVVLEINLDAKKMLVDWDSDE